MTAKSTSFVPALSWRSERLTWKVFQKLSLLLYWHIYDDFGAEEYLKQGHFQDGVDILSFKNSTGKNTSIQNKHYNYLGLSDLKEIIGLFLISEFFKTSDVFIITTSADLQHPDIQAYLQEQKVKFFDKYQIEFDCWDVSRMEDYLKGQFQIVQYYFSLEQAKRHCFAPAMEEKIYPEFKGYLQRHITELKETEVEASYCYLPEKTRSTLTLENLFTESYLQPKHICVIAEAYEGKSTLFNQAAFELSGERSPYTVLLLTLKSETIQPVENLLQLHYGSWMSVAAKDLVVLIDGLDEVPSDRFLEMVDHIRTFCKLHPVHVAFSCRKLFFSNFELEKELPEFNFLEVLELSYGQSLRYMDEHLGTEAKAFYNRMELLRLVNLLATPFYLVKLVKWYNTPGQAMPKNKSEIALKFIDESIDISGARRLVGGRQLRQLKVRYKKLLSALAFALQVRGINSADDELIQELFETADREILIHSSILQISKGNWTFVNAFFQEQLSALALSHYSVEQIFILITIGSEVKKIKTKWIQTICTYLSFLAQNDTKRERLISMIENDNVELLALSEGNKFSPAFRLEILKKIIARTIYHHSRLTTIDESNLADFIGNEDDAVNFLFETLKSSVPSIVKVTCLRTLRHIKLSGSHANSFATVSTSEVAAVIDPYYGKLLLESMAFYKTGDQELIDKLKANETMTRHHNFREGIYQLLKALTLIDENYPFLIEGLEVLYQYNTGTSHLGSERRLLELLVETDNPLVIRKLFREVSKNNFQAFFRYQKEHVKQFVNKLQKKAAKIFETDMGIIFPVMAFVTEIGHVHVDDEFSGILEFFKTTGSYRLALQIYLLENDESKRSYVFSDIIMTDCFDALIYAAEEGLMTMGHLRNFRGGLYHTRRPKEAEELEQLIKDAFGQPEPEISAKYEQYACAEQNKQNNDLRYIASPEAFLAGIKSIYKKLRKKEIQLEDLNFKYEDDYLPLSVVNSYLACQFLREHADERLVSLKYAVKMIEDQEHFQLWRVAALLNSHLCGQYPEFFRGQLKTYYDENVGTFPFASINMDSSFEQRKKAVQFLKIWEKYEFETADDVLLEFIRMNSEGFNCLQFAKNNRRKSITAMLLSKFEGKEQKLKEKVLANLRAGLQNTEVIGAHIELCEQLKLSDALPDILKLIYKNNIPYGNSYHLIDAYVVLDGRLKELLPYFNQITDLDGYEFILLVKTLMKQFPEEVKKRLADCFHYSNISASRKMEAAQLLAKMGVQEGFSYIIGKVAGDTESPYHIQSNFEIWNVDTNWALSLLEPLMPIMVDETLPQFKFYSSPEHFMLEVLKGLGSKSESDLKIVKQFLIGQEQRFSKTFPAKAGHLVWHAEQMEETFRMKTGDPMSAAEIKKLMTVILD